MPDRPDLRFVVIYTSVDNYYDSLEYSEHNLAKEQGMHVLRTAE